MATTTTTKEPAEPLALILTPERPQYPEGNALPDFKVAIKNTTKKPIKICTYMLRYRLMLAMVVKDEQGFDYGLYPFRTGRWEELKPSHLKTLAPGEQITDTIQLSHNEDWGLVRTGSQAPLLAPRHAAKGFAAGTVTFSTLLFDKMSIYSGQDGVYDHTLSPKAVPDELPGAKSLSLTDVYRGDIRGTVKVKFGSR